MARKLEYPLGIVHVITCLRPGGVASHIFYLLDGLDRRKWNPMVVSLMPGEDDCAPFREQAIPVVNLGITEVSGVPTLIRAVTGISRAARGVRAVVVHTHFDRASYYGRLAAKLAGVPVAVRTVHGAEEMTRGRMRREKRLGVFTDRYIAVSGSTRDYMSAHGFDESRIAVIPNGVPASRFHPDEADRESVRSELGLDGDTVLVGSIARLDPDKDVGALVEVAAIVLAKRGDVRFVVAGDGSQRASIEEKARDLGIADRFTLLGLRSDIPRLLRGFDVFALSSPMEGMPVALVEAMLTGVAAVGPAVGGITEVLADGAGLLASPADAASLAECICRLANPGLRADIAGRGLERARAVFSAEAFVANTESLYFETMRQKGISLPPRGVA